MKTIRFNAILKIRGVNPYILVSPVRANAIKSGWRKPLPVLVRINGKPKTFWRINMMPVGNGGFYLYLHGQVRKVSNVAVGNRVSVEVGFDSAYKGGPAHPMPAMFRSALKNNLRAKKSWEALSPSRKKEVLRYFHQLKSPEALRRNVERALEMLSGKTGRFMARTWSDGA